MQEFINQYYAWLSGIANWISIPLGDLAYSINAPLISVLLFGIVGSSAPCQISSSMAVLAYLSRDIGSPQALWAKTLAFIAGKATVYSLVGGVIIFLGLQLDQISSTAVPLVVIARRAIGPLLILVGLIMLGIWKSKLSIGDSLSGQIQKRFRGKPGYLPAYLLGVALSFAFCPTLFWLFFGLTIPIAIGSAGGLVFPGVFALGTALPIFFLGSLFATGAINLTGFVSRFKSTQVWVQRIAAIVFILVGINETLLYWYL
jgi:cytochrome c-type biogenesis protein